MLDSICKGLEVPKIKMSAREGIRTLELLRDRTLNPAPLTGLDYPRVRCSIGSGE